MKRLRDDKNEYLGGDLVDLPHDGGEDGVLCKADRNIARKVANKKWKLVDRKVGSGVDPCPRHTLYYREQLADLADDEEWERFQTSLTQPLPVTFRFGGYCPHSVRASLRKQFENEFRTMTGRFVEVGGVILHDDIVKKIGWPGDDVYQIAADSLTLSKNEGLQPLSSVLRREVHLGHVVRQELASMIPALLLGIEGHHNVLDLCAAPGSKTEQLLTLMRENAETPPGSKCPQATGMVVANDPDPERIRTLKGRYDKSLSPNFLVTCATAEDLAGRFSSGPAFERILADVPCSGDGTIRKFPHIWRLFRPRMAIELHGIQLGIGLAAVSMLRDGGRLVYSTCSINPIEDEAVVAALLREHWADGLRLVDTRVAGLLPLLRSRPGLSSWRCDEDIFVCGETEDTRQETLRRLPPFSQSLAPPSDEEAELFQLDRCHRILPHDNDTGGFFVAVLELDRARQSDDRGTDRRSGKSGQKKESVSVMKQLGYNPKRMSKKPSAAKSARTTGKTTGLRGAPKIDSFGASYDSCENDEALRLFKKLNLNISSEFERESLGAGKNVIVKSTELGAAGEMEYSMVSKNVFEALSSWAQTGDSEAADEPYCLVHAGVPIALASNAMKSLRPGPVSARIDYLLASYSAHAVRPLLSEVCGFEGRDFSLLASIGAMEDEDRKNQTLNMLLCGDRTVIAPNEGPRFSTAARQRILDYIHATTTGCAEGKSSSVMNIFITCESTLSRIDAADLVSAGKKRLSKAERKKLKNNQQSISKRKNTASSNAVLEAPTSFEDKSVSPDKIVDAVIVLRCHAPSGFELVDVDSFQCDMTLVTPQDICKSFATALAVI